uniref:Uncharacterized protein n=1 Tax=Polysiphonia sp. TaxID=1967842 RepID=A0A1Z1MT87_9FLOR|nr:hypothetical protein [Polysiphonia sp.]
MDKAYFKILIVNQKIIDIYYFSGNYAQGYTYHYPICFRVQISQYDYIFMLLSKFSAIKKLSTQHKLYLGEEICKVKISLSLRQTYIQN